jgi:hypothetical protein
MTKDDQIVLEYFTQERAKLERDPLWRAAWFAAQAAGRESFTYDGVEWWT